MLISRVMRRSQGLAGGLIPMEPIPTGSRRVCARVLLLLLFGELQYPQLQSLDHSLGTVGDPELGHYVLDVALDGAPAYEQLLGDLTVAAPLLDELEHLQLAGREHIGR